MDQFVGYLSNEVLREIKETNLGDKWRTVIVRDYTNTVRNCVRIVPSSLVRNYCHFQDILNFRKPYQMTAVVHCNERNALLMRRGIVNDSKDDFHRTIEHNLAMVYKMSSQEELIDDLKIQRITIVSFYDDFNNLIPKFKHFRSNITLIRKRSNFIKSKLLKYNIFDSFISANCHLKNTNPALKYILHFTTYISMLYNLGESILFEDTKDLNISYIMTSMVKLINNPRYCTINGFIYLIKFDWVNFSYNFKDGSTPYIEKSRDYLCPFRLFIQTVQYLVFTNPEMFEFNFEIFDLIENFVIGKNIILPDTIFYEDAFEKILNLKENYVNKGFYSRISLYQKYEDSIVLSNIGNLESTQMYDDLAYVKFWDYFLQRIIPKHIML